MQVLLVVRHLADPVSEISSAGAWGLPALLQHRQGRHAQAHPCAQGFNIADLFPLPATRCRGKQKKQMAPDPSTYADLWHSRPSTWRPTSTTKPSGARDAETSQIESIPDVPRFWTLTTGTARWSAACRAEEIDGEVVLLAGVFVGGFNRRGGACSRPMGSLLHPPPSTAWPAGCNPSTTSGRSARTPCCGGGAGAYGEAAGEGAPWSPPHLRSMQVWCPLSGGAGTGMAGAGAARGLASGQEEQGRRAGLSLVREE